MIEKEAWEFLNLMTSKVLICSTDYLNLILIWRFMCINPWNWIPARFSNFFICFLLNRQWFYYEWSTWKCLRGSWSCFWSWIVSYLLLYHNCYFCQISFALLCDVIGSAAVSSNQIQNLNHSGLGQLCVCAIY